MRRAVRFLVPLAVLLLAGCAAPPAADTPSPDAPAVASASWPTLPCAPDPAPGLSSSLEVVHVETFAWDPMAREELDSIERDGRVVLAAARPDVGGVDLLDVTDPRAPTLVSSWLPEDDGYADDVKFLPDGSALVVGGQDKLRLVDVTDLSWPTLEADLELEGNGAHMVATWHVAGKPYVSISKAEGGDLSIFAVTGVPGERSFQRLAHLAATPLGDVGGRPDPLRTHDTWLDDDPVLGKPILWVANVWWGIIAYDVSDPAAPLVVATIPNSVPHAGYMHNVQVAHLDGRRLVVGVQEYGTGVLKVWDATDLATPRHVASFAPGLVTTAFHNLQVVDGYAFAGHFDEGLYVIDLRTVPDGALPEDIQPFAHAPAGGSREARVPVGLVQGNFGTQDVEVRNGVVWTSEAGIGVQALAFGCFAFGDASLSSTG